MLFSRIVNGWAGGTIRHTFARSDEGTALQRGLMWNYELVLPNQGVPFVMNAHDRCKGIWDGQEPPRAACNTLLHCSSSRDISQCPDGCAEKKNYIKLTTKYVITI